MILTEIHKSETQKSACFLLLTTPSSSSKNVQRSETKGAYFLLLTTLSSKERSQHMAEQEHSMEQEQHSTRLVGGDRYPPPPES
ncbi:hypothetical protein K1719_031996 [Acacia pycnantha]|nr:hypothetical protein K1719_031996 [Acacia pycnantha]